MKLVVGLGNPGKQYQHTRHNVGFAILRECAQRGGAGPVKARFQGEVAEVNFGGESVLLLSPLTYMNRSGLAVRAAADFYKLLPAQILVICDDMNLPLGTLRYRPKGSAGGQKGLADVARHLGTEEFARLRVGIGRPPESMDPADFVLQRFGGGEEPVIRHAVDLAAGSVVDWVSLGTEACMNRYNGGSAPASPSAGDRDP